MLIQQVEWHKCREYNVYYENNIDYINEMQTIREGKRNGISCFCSLCHTNMQSPACVAYDVQTCQQLEN